MSLMKVKICNGVGEANTFLKTNPAIRHIHVVNDQDVGALIVYHYEE